MSYIDYRALTWPEARALGDRGRVLGLVPLGALEQHGPHLPLGTDSLIAEVLARRVADRFEEDVVVTPVVFGGLSEHHVAFPGTVTFAEPVFHGIVEAYVDALRRIGIREIAVFSAHGGNFAFLTRFAAAYRQRHGDCALAVYDDLERYFGVTFEGARRAGFSPVETDWHAGGIETSQGLFAFPELVREFDAVSGYTANEEGWLARVLAEGIHSVSPTGVLGSPAGATAQAGVAIFEALARELVRWIGHELGYSARRDKVL